MSADSYFSGPGFDWKEAMQSAIEEAALQQKMMAAIQPKPLQIDSAPPIEMLVLQPGPSPSFTAFMDFLLEDIAKATGISLSEVNFIRSMPHPSERWKN